VADIVLLSDRFSMLPRAVAEGRRIARNIHRLGRLYLTKTVYAATLIATVGIAGWAFPFLPRHLTLAATLTIGIPSFVLALAPSDGPLYRGRLLRALSAFAVPAGLAMAAAYLLSFFLVDTVFGGTLEEGRTAATTTLIVLGLCFILLLERGPGREHIAIQGYVLAMVASLGALFAAVLAAAPVRDFFDMKLLAGGQWFLALLCVAAGLVMASVIWRLPQVQHLVDEPPYRRREGTLEPPRSSRRSGRPAGSPAFSPSSSRPEPTSCASTSPTRRRMPMRRPSSGSGRPARRRARRSESSATCLGRSSGSATSPGTLSSSSRARSSR
jgi:magnesium-transporting ATPase (P-type)